MEDKVGRRKVAAEEQEEEDEEEEEGMGRGSRRRKTRKGRRNNGDESRWPLTNTLVPSHKAHDDPGEGGGEANSRNEGRRAKGTCALGLSVRGQVSEDDRLAKHPHGRREDVQKEAGVAQNAKRVQRGGADLVQRETSREATFENWTMCQCKR